MAIVTRDEKQHENKSRVIHRTNSGQTMKNVLLKTKFDVKCENVENMLI